MNFLFTRVSDLWFLDIPEIEKSHERFTDIHDIQKHLTKYV